MAKRRRRRARERPPLDLKKKRSRTHLDALPAPNHNIPLDLPDITNASLNDDPDARLFSMLYLAMPDGESGDSAGIAFVDSIYGTRRWVDRDASAPPTWMDPELFIRMVVSDPRVRCLCRKYVETGKVGQKNNLKALIDEIFEEVYLVYLFEQFKKVKTILADWTVGHFARKIQDAVDAS